MPVFRSQRISTSTSFFISRPSLATIGSCNSEEETKEKKEKKRGKKHACRPVADKPTNSSTTKCSPSEYSNASGWLGQGCGRRGKRECHRLQVGSRCSRSVSISLPLPLLPSLSLLRLHSRQRKIGGRIKT